ncbi:MULTISPECIES: class III lanthionine synthetase LanKC N-terminal domain-containing protein [unclassified Corallococcus]|uniref:class III lanthionine synthetase LanKC N-terminal domain-containing protein n=1 Tax=unclassified Corallococcus TaxID=2685029 RepID=UPI001A8F746F|nr:MULTISPECIES: hypothetical protein [unclassified Corallococcus]MBN9684694.1 hypothetical protein [Corallococcus sp. NCSPR001]WAS83834.1 hypothetical protein O0N60_31595 [Corallococcus sp. NCRR]
MEEFSFYTLTHPDYFETLSRFPVSQTYPGLLKSLLPPDWSISSFDVFLKASFERAVLTPQGFKIHVSSSVADAETVLRRVVPECVRAGVTFKIVADPFLLRFLNSKRYSRGGSGKFVTIYPPDEPTFRTLIEAIHQATKDLKGPYVLSDKRYRDSKLVFYRYGGFQRMYEQRTDGMKTLMIRKPDNTWVADDRLPYFNLPSWVQDPFPEEEAGPGSDSELLNGRYDVQGAFTFTNTGGVYKALDRTTGQTVVLKEARPYTEAWMGGDRTVDAIVALRQEHDILQRLGGLPCVPQVVELFQEWEHTFLVTTFFEGVSLASLRASDDFIVMTNMDDPERITRFCTEWRELALRLLDAVESIHARGVLVGDISPGNVLANRETKEIGLIDFEGALVRGGDSPFEGQWFNPGFRKPERRTSRKLEPFDDFYACGMLLYNLVCPIQNLLELDKGQPAFRILDHFIEAGLPEQIRTLIRELLEGRPQAARQVAEAWNPQTR